MGNFSNTRSWYIQFCGNQGNSWVHSLFPITRGHEVSECPNRFLSNQTWRNHSIEITSHLPSRKTNLLLLRRFFFFSQLFRKKSGWKFQIKWNPFLYLEVLFYSCLSQDAITGLWGSILWASPVGQLLDTQMSENWKLSPGYFSEGRKRRRGKRGSWFMLGRQTFVAWAYLW